MFRAEIICINIETPAVYTVERGAMVIGMVDFNDSVPRYDFTMDLRRADLAEIRQTLEWLDAQPTVEDEQAGRGLPRFISMLPGRRF